MTKPPSQVEENADYSHLDRINKLLRESIAAQIAAAADPVAVSAALLISQRTPGAMPTVDTEHTFVSPEKIDGFLKKNLRFLGDVTEADQRSVRAAYGSILAQLPPWQRELLFAIDRPTFFGYEKDISTVFWKGAKTEGNRQTPTGFYSPPRSRMAWSNTEFSDANFVSISTGNVRTCLKSFQEQDDEGEDGHLQ